MLVSIWRLENKRTIPCSRCVLVVYAKLTSCYCFGGKQNQGEEEMEAVIQQTDLSEEAQLKPLQMLSLHWLSGSNALHRVFKYAHDLSRARPIPLMHFASVHDRPLLNSCTNGQ